MQYIFEVSGEFDTIMMSLEQDDAGVDKDVGDKHKTVGIIIMKVCIGRLVKVKTSSTALKIQKELYLLFSKLLLFCYCLYKDCFKLLLLLFIIKQQH